MIKKFSYEDTTGVGNKAKFLMEMKKAGFNVPDGFVLDSDTYKEGIKYNALDSKIKGLLDELNKDNVDEISDKICSLFDDFKFKEETEKEILSLVKKDQLYAVRSSGTKEDLDEFSFAGQYKTFLNVEVKDILKNIIDCYK